MLLGVARQALSGFDLALTDGDSDTDEVSTDYDPQILFGGIAVYSEQSRRVKRLCRTASAGSVLVAEVRAFSTLTTSDSTSSSSQ